MVSTSFLEPPMSLNYRANAASTIAAALCLLTAACHKSGGPVACDQLAALSLPDTTIASARLVEKGAFLPPNVRAGDAAAAPFANLPAFCRVTATIKTADSNVSTEVWLPAAGWTGDFQPAGSSFWGTNLPYARMAALLGTGVATAGTNLGIEGATGPSFVLKNPEKLANLGNRPYHALVEHAKAVIAADYGRPPQLTLIDECGGGGSRDALAAVQRWPADFDAAAATSFTNYGTHHGLAQMWLFQATHKDKASFIPPAKYPMLHQAVLDACDAKDGVKDGVIEDPPHCAFDPGTLTCRGADAPDCLTGPQVEAVRRVYEVPKHARTHEPLYGPMVPGSELSWEPMTVSDRPYPYSEAFYKYIVFKDPNWDFRTRPANFDTDVDRADAPENRAINALDPNIAPFADRGGKLLLMAGWNDDLGPGNNITYYENVVAALGAGRAGETVRLFMIPGMHHCLNIDYQVAYVVKLDVPAVLREWVRTKKAPDQLIVTTSMKNQPDRRRLVCPYPKVSAYTGQGSTDDPANFVCRE
jgi:feruloyl esterase